MRTEDHLVGTSIPRFTYDTPSSPGNDFYRLRAGDQPPALIFLPPFDHPITPPPLSPPPEALFAPRPPPHPPQKKPPDEQRRRAARRENRQQGFNKHGSL